MCLSWPDFVAWETMHFCQINIENWHVYEADLRQQLWIKPGRPRGACWALHWSVVRISTGETVYWCTQRTHLAGLLGANNTAAERGAGRIILAVCIAPLLSTSALVYTISFPIDVCISLWLYSEAHWLCLFLFFTCCCLNVLYVD